MYAIYGDIYHQYTPSLLAYIPYMDPMGTQRAIFGISVSKRTQAAFFVVGSGYSIFALLTEKFRWEPRLGIPLWK